MLRVITTNIDFKDTIEGNVSLTPVSQQVITATGLISGPKGERGEKGEKGDPGIAWVTSVQGFNGDIVLTKEHIGLSDVDNTSDLAKPISTATQTALSNKADSTHTHTASSVTDLDNAVSNNSTVQANTSARHTHDNKDTLDATTASYTTVKDTKLSGIATGATANATDAQLRDRTTHTGAQAISTVTGLQTALDGKQATITAGTTSQYYRGDKSWQTLDKASVGLANVDNTSDANKIISTATQAALDTKATTTALTAHTNNTSNPHSVTKAQVGLGNVDNTSDANKPVSTAQQTALNTKVDKEDIGLREVTLTNMVKNSSFINTNGWTSDYGTLSTSNGRLVSTAASGSGGRFIYNTSTPVSPGDDIFISIKLKSKEQSFGEGSYAVYLSKTGAGSAVLLADHNIIEGRTATSLHYIAKTPANWTGNYRIVISQNPPSSSVYELWDVNSINLTQSFGSEIPENNILRAMTDSLGGYVDDTATIDMTDLENAFYNSDYRATITSRVNTAWDGWKDPFYSYGMNTSIAKVPTMVNGLTEYDSTMIVRPTPRGYRRWGLHLFEGWSNNGTDRLTILTDKHPNYVEIYHYYQPPNGVPEDENYKWVKIGSDIADTAYDFSKDEAIMHGDVKFNKGVTLGTSSNSPKVLAGTGFPEGVVTANVGTVYIDTAVTNGASSWIKKSGTGNTGWKVLEGDTGLRGIPAEELLNGWTSTTTNSRALTIRRVGNVVSLESPAITGVDGTSASTGIFWEVPAGFRTNLAGNYSTIGLYLYSGTTYAVAKDFDKLSTSRTPGGARAFHLTWLTNQAWPSTLPGISAY